jgi:hypothetical protein
VVVITVAVIMVVIIALATRIGREAVVLDSAAELDAIPAEVQLLVAEGGACGVFSPVSPLEHFVTSRAHDPDVEVPVVVQHAHFGALGRRLALPWLGLDEVTCDSSARPVALVEPASTTMGPCARVAGSSGGVSGGGNAGCAAAPPTVSRSPVPRTSEVVRVTTRVGAPGGTSSTPGGRVPERTRRRRATVDNACSGTGGTSAVDGRSTARPRGERDGRPGCMVGDACQKRT